MGNQSKELAHTWRTLTSTVTTRKQDGKEIHPHTMQTVFYSHPHTTTNTQPTPTHPPTHPFKKKIPLPTQKKAQKKKTPPPHPKEKNNLHIRCLHSRTGCVNSLLTSNPAPTHPPPPSPTHPSHVDLTAPLSPPFTTPLPDAREHTIKRRSGRAKCRNLTP